MGHGYREIGGRVPSRETPFKYVELHDLLVEHENSALVASVNMARSSNSSGFHTKGDSINLVVVVARRLSTMVDEAVVPHQEVTEIMGGVLQLFVNGVDCRGHSAHLSSFECLYKCGSITSEHSPGQLLAC